jgi:hypothetical protein
MNKNMNRWSLVMAVVLASGLLVASGALAAESGWGTGPQAQQVGYRHQVDIMAPNTMQFGQDIPPSKALIPAGSRHQVDVMAQNTLHFNRVVPPSKAEMPAGVRHEVNVMAP